MKAYNDIRTTDLQVIGRAELEAVEGGLNLAIFQSQVTLAVKQSLINVAAELAPQIRFPVPKF